MKRLTDTGKWHDPWFMELEGRFKLVWYYLTDSCDCAGIIRPNIRLMRFVTGCDFDEQEVLDAMEGRVVVLDSGKWFIPKFVEFQQNTTELNPKNNAHLGILRRLEKEGISISPTLAPSQPLVRGTSKSKSNSKGNSKSKFIEPDLSEWLDYAATLSPPYDRKDAEGAYNHYAAKGWMIGKNKMRDWKAACRTCWSRWKPAQRTDAETAKWLLEQ